MGSRGGSGFAAPVGGLMTENVGWRWIVFAGAAISLLGMFVVLGMPESKAPPKAGYRLDLAGVLSFMVFMVALQVFVTQGANMGWTRLPSLALLAVSIVFAMHNMPGLELGTFKFTPGQMMSAVDNWEIELIAKGAHGAMPELGIDPVVAGSSLVMALRTIVSRNLSPQHQAVVTVGAFQAGEAGNVVARLAILRLSIRTTTSEDREMVLNKVSTLTKTQAEWYGCPYEIREGMPGAVLVNDPDETRKAYEIARDAFGEERVVFPDPTFLASEDFAFMLQKKKGTCCFIGNGDTPMVHHPHFTINPAILPRGAAYWVALTEEYLR